jgi:hypothetical protein
MILKETEFDKECECGTGLRFGECCGKVLIQMAAEAAYREKFQNPRLISTKFGKRRARAVWNKIYFRPLTEHLHEFIVKVLILTLGKSWFKAQREKVPEEQHIIIRWIDARSEFFKQVESLNLTPKDRIVPPGEVMELIALARDVYYLQLVNKLPKPLRDRLIDYDAFQGARYEIAVAASLVRVGFEIEWIQNKQSKKHCEFNAIHKVTNEVIAVETKSRRRSGVYHQEGDLPDLSIIKTDIFSLYNEAMSQNPSDKPFGVFIDINLPSQRDRATIDRDWVKNLLQKIEQEGKSVFRSPPPAFVGITNSGWFYEGKSPAGRGESLAFVLQDATHPLKTPLTIEALFEALNLFSIIPDEDI